MSARYNFARAHTKEFKRAQAAEAERGTLLAQVEKMRSALEPFSEFSGYLFVKNAEDDDVVARTRVNSDFGAAIATLTFKAFRLARALAAERERATLAERARCAALCAEAARLHRNGQQSAFDDGDFHRAEIQMKLAHNEEFLAAEIARP